MNGAYRLGKFELRLCPLLLAPARRPCGGSITPPLDWLYCAAHQVARLRRPRIGSITPPADNGRGKRKFLEEPVEITVGIDAVSAACLDQRIEVRTGVRTADSVGEQPYAVLQGRPSNGGVIL